MTVSSRGTNIGLGNRGCDGACLLPFCSGTQSGPSVGRTCGIKTVFANLS